MDLASLDKWDDYTAAKEDMFALTDTEIAPWTVLKSNDKKRARVNAMRHILGKFDYDGKDHEVVGQARPPHRRTRPARHRLIPGRPEGGCVRFVATVLLWLVTTVALAAAIPAMWAQKNIVDANGYATFAQSAAKDRKLQQAMASELTTQIVSLASNEGYDLNPDLVREVTTAYTQNAGFPGQFAQANRIVHTWMFTDEIRRQEGTDDRWLIDVAPMLSDPSLRQTLGNLNLDVPDTLTVPITVSDTSGMQPGQLRQLSTWGPWVSVGATVLTGVFALLTLAAARARGKALAALGVSALLVGAAGWAGLEVARRYINHALDRTTGDIRQVADAIVNHAEGGMHQWLNLTLAAGGVLLVFGVLVSMLGGLRRRD